jgi:hypothetical protein
MKTKKTVVGERQWRACNAVAPSIKKEQGGMMMGRGQGIYGISRTWLVCRDMTHSRLAKFESL